MNILEALAALDVEDSDHWTAEGAPKVDVVQEVTGDATLTRAMITEAAPLFSRENTVLEVPNPEPETPSDPNTDLDEDASNDDDDASNEDDDGDETSNDDDDDDDGEVATGREHPDIVATQAKLDELNEDKAELEKVIAEGQKFLESLFEKHAPLRRSAKDNQVGIMDHIKSQLAQREKRVNAGAAFAKLMHEQVKSPLDAAAERETGHGKGRKVRGDRTRHSERPGKRGGAVQAAADNASKDDS